ncbi:MAG: Ig-like domain-containing protein [Treponema sp.]|jgi:transglutaminase/protease-like cytokinesis protein 3|nr:Ig-like domain-containing protein [Treponema sp.]
MNARKQSKTGALAAGLLALLPALALTGCPSEAPAVAVSGVSLNKTSLTLKVGATETLAATVSPGDAANKAVTWMSSDPTKAIVSSGGSVVAVAAGQAFIIVTTDDGGKTATCTVTIPVDVESVSLNTTSLTLTAGAAETLAATVSPGNASNKAVTWTSSNAAIAAISSDGVVSAVEAGQATITVTTDDGGKTATCTVTVNALVNAAMPSITAQPQGATYTAGHTATALSVTASVSDGGTLSYQWYKNTANSTSGGEPVGTNSSTYVPSITTVETVYYYVVVTNTNNSVTGATTAAAASAVAKIVVEPSGTAGLTIALLGYGQLAIQQGAAAWDGTAITLDKSENGSVTLSAEGFTSVKWYVDGAVTSSTNTLTISAANYGVYTHSITFVGEQDGVPYSQVIPFTVVE